MIQLGKYEKYLTEEFLDDYRAGTMSQHLARPEDGEAGPAVLVCHENRGLTPHIQDAARRFAGFDYLKSQAFVDSGR